jgi:hypothetical protein
MQCSNLAHFLVVTNNLANNENREAYEYEKFIGMLASTIMSKLLIKLTEE